MTLSCSLEERQPVPAVTIRTRAAARDLPVVLSDVYGRLLAHLFQHEVQPAGAPFVIYRSMDMDDLDIEAGVPVRSSLPETDDISAGEMPGGRAVTCVHEGPYGTLGETYDAVTTWMEENGLEASGTGVEVYLNDPAETAEDELRTLIVIMLTEASE